MPGFGAARAARVARAARGVWRGRPRTRRAVIAGALAVPVALSLVEVAFWGDAAAQDTARYITDAQGRALILRGLNTASSAKSAPDGMPDYPEKMVDQEHRLLGTNFVRFLIQWRNVEPRPGAYDDGYLDKVAERVSWYAERGMYVMLDMHQDVYGPATGGNGAPVWATETDGLPAEEQDPWELGYIQPGTLRAHDHFWNTTGKHPELRRHYADAWKHVARRFAGNPAVLGYDLMNEPWGGSLPGLAFERGPLSDLYQRTTDAIRRVDRDKWIFVEPRAVGVNWGLASGLRPIDDPRPGEARIGYAPHVYPLPIDLGGAYTGSAKSWTERTLNAWSRTVRATARRQNAPIVLGEYGTDISRPGALEFVKSVQSVTEAMGAGQVYWSADPEGGWGPWKADGTPSKLAAVLARAYPRAVAGLPTRLRYDEKTAALTLAFRDKAGVTGTTDVWLPEDDYPRGATVTSSDAAGSWKHTWDAEARVLSITTPRTGGEHTVTVRPAP